MKITSRLWKFVLELWQKITAFLTRQNPAPAQVVKPAPKMEVEAGRFLHPIRVSKHDASKQGYRHHHKSPYKICKSLPTNHARVVAGRAAMTATEYEDQFPSS